MNETAATQTQRSPVLAGIRRAEALLLVPLAFAPLVTLGPVGAPLSLLMLGVAAVLLPREREAAPATPEQRRLDLVRRLLTDGQELHRRHAEVHDRPGSLQRSQALTVIRLDIIEWIADSRARLERFPEFAGIFDAHGTSDLIEELDARLARLTEIARLAQASRRLGLPI